MNSQHCKNCRAGRGILAGLLASALLVWGLPVTAQTIQQQIPEIIDNPSGDPVDIKSLSPEQIESGARQTLSDMLKSGILIAGD